MEGGWREGLDVHCLLDGVLGGVVYPLPLALVLELEILGDCVVSADVPRSWSGRGSILLCWKARYVDITHSVICGLHNPIRTNPTDCDNVPLTPKLTRARHSPCRTESPSP